MFPTRRMAYTMAAEPFGKCGIIPHSRPFVSVAIVSQPLFIRPMEETYVFYCQNCCRPQTAQPLSDRGRIRRWKALPIRPGDRGRRRTIEGIVQARRFQRQGRTDAPTAEPAGRG